MRFSPLAVAPAVLLMVTLAAPAHAQVADHLECYKIKDPLNLAAVVDLNAPQFGLEAGCKVSKATLFCAPASKSVVSARDKFTGLPITPLPFSGAPQPGDQICYRMTCPRPLVPIPDRAATDQFGAGRTLTKFKTSMLCVPAVTGTAYCGDGTIDAGEDCEPTDLGGATCTSLGFASGTLACAPGCTFDLGGCVPNLPETSGNGTIESPESCDGANLGGATCTSLGYASGVLACTVGCGFNTSGCTPYPAPTCGNGSIESPESCDGANLGGATCVGFGFASGSLACTAGCGYDVSGCAAYPAPTCGNGTIESPESCDGSNLGGATCTTLGFASGVLVCTAGCGYDVSGCTPYPAPPTPTLTPTPAPTSTARFVDNGDGTVSDRQTGLQWEKKDTAVGSGVNLADPHDVDNTYTWNGSGSPYPSDGTAFTDFLGKLNNCVDDGTGQPPTGVTGGFAGQCDWRLPTIVELQTILLAPYPCGTSPCIDPIFGPTAASYSSFYWSSTTFAKEPDGAWDVPFGNSFVTVDHKWFPLHVRAVRGGS